MSKYLISVDIEGITGVVNKNFSKENGKFYQQACRYMVSDVNAVIRGILNAEAEAEIIVRDAHGVNAVNLDLEKLHPKATLTQGWDAVQNMLTGINQDITGVFLVGYHAGGHNIQAVLSHTMHSIIHWTKVNDKIMNETGLFALYAGYYNVPVAFISGDNYAVSEAQEQLGNVVGVMVKQSYGRGSANSLSLEQASRLLEKNAELAVKKLKQQGFSPFKIGSPLSLEIKFYDTGVRVSVLQNLSQLLAFDTTYQFNCKEHTLIFQAENIMLLLQRLSMLLFLVYGIQSSNN